MFSEISLNELSVTFDCTTADLLRNVSVFVHPLKYLKLKNIYFCALMLTYTVLRLQQLLSELISSTNADLHRYTFQSSGCKAEVHLHASL